MKEWVRMPSNWIRDEEILPLRKLRWAGSNKADQIAALMLYMALVHHANNDLTLDKSEVGLSSLTYTELCDITGLSRAKVSGGLKVLINLDVISQVGSGRNNLYKIINYGTKSGWAKLPAKGLYSADLRSIPAFHNFNLRSKIELNALKIYFLIVTLRSNQTNYAQVAYDRISFYTGMHRNEIRAAISFLINLELLQVDTGNSEVNAYATINMYRLCHLEVYKHRGTNSRGETLVRT